jgi:hypothetical protein
MTSVSNALNAGLGVMPITRRRAIKTGINIWVNAPLPKLPDLYSGIFIREGGPHVIYEQLADEIAAVVLDPADQKLGLPDATRKNISAA